MAHHGNYFSGAHMSFTMCSLKASLSDVDQTCFIHPIVIPRSNSLCCPRAKGKVSEIPYSQQEGRNFDSAATNCLSLAVSETEAWKKLTVYYHKDPHLDCPILPATLSKSLMHVSW